MNGDLLCFEKISKLLVYENMEMIVSCHISPNEIWDDAIFLEKVKQKMALFHPNDYTLHAKEGNIQAQCLFERCSIVVFTRNFVQNGINRAGTVQDVLVNRGVRTQPCLRPQHDFTVSYDGTVYPCCQF